MKEGHPVEYGLRALNDQVFFFKLSASRGWRIRGVDILKSASVACIWVIRRYKAREIIAVAVAFVTFVETEGIIA